MPRTSRTVRNTALSALIMLVLFILLGVGYVLYSERQDSGPISTVAVNKKEAEPVVPEPPAPRADATEFAAIEALNTPVKAGTNTSVSVKTLATSKCTIAVSYKDVPSKDSGLVPKTADKYGSITWSWTVEPTASVGNWPVNVTCVYKNGKSAFVQGNLQVTD